jgi:hypothetical protein
MLLSSGSFFHASSLDAVALCIGLVLGNQPFSSQVDVSEIKGVRNPTHASA